MPEPPTIHLMCGLVASGKTTLARQLAQDLPALRLSRDEWMIRLFDLSYDDPVYVNRLDPCTDLLWDVAIAALNAGVSVVLDWNFLSRERRADAMRRAADAGFPIQVHWLTTPVEVAIGRANVRNAKRVPDAHVIDGEGVRHSAAIFEPPNDDEQVTVIKHSGDAP